MFKVLFGDVKEGRLMRLPYLGYSLLLTLVAIVLLVVIVLAIGAGEHLVGGNLEQAQNKLREWFTVPFVIIFGLVSVLFTFAGVNIMAKRIRDAGLPGWWMVLAIAILTGIVSTVVSNEAGSGLHTLIWLALLFIPTNTFSKEQSQ